MDTMEVFKKFRSSKDWEERLEWCSDDVTWTVPGTHRFAGTKRGKEEIREKMLGPLQKEFDGGQATPGIMHPLGAPITEGEYVVVRWYVTDRKTKTGKSYDNTYCLVLRVVEGKVTEMAEHVDTECVTAAFGR